MYHSISFGDGSVYPSSHEKAGQFMGTNTWDDWHLIPSKRPDIAMPGISTNFIEIPGRDGPIDMTDYLIGRPNYGARSGSIEFYVANDFEHYETIRVNIASFIHGQTMKMCLVDDDPNWYYEGRFSMNEWRSDPANSMVVINYALGPYKWPVHDWGTQLMLWDPFNFEMDYDWYAGLHGISPKGGSVSMNLPGFGGTLYLKAKMTAAGSLTISLNGNSITLNSVGQEKSFSTYYRGSSSLVVSGTGTVDITVKGGSL